MATSIISPAMQRKAEALADLLHTFPRGSSRTDGTGFYIIPGTKPLTAHYSNVHGCTCRSYQHRGVCAHNQACKILQRRSDAVIEAQHAPKARVSYSVLFDDDEPARVTIVRPCAIRGCPVEAGTDSALCPHHTREQRTAVAA